MLKMAATLSEIDSFTAKFKALMMKGVKVTLTVEAIEGEVFITLKAGLRLKCLSQVHENPSPLYKRPRSPAYFRRQAKRKLERQYALKADEVKVDNATEIDIVFNRKVDTVEVDTVEVDTVEVDTQAEKAVENGIDTMKHTLKGYVETEVYKFGYWSEKEVTTNDAVKQLEHRLAVSFKENRVKEEDQVYEICNVEHIDDHELELNLKIQKECPLLRLAVKKIQTVYSDGDAYELSFQGISN